MRPPSLSYLNHPPGQDKQQDTQGDYYERTDAGGPVRRLDVARPGQSLYLRRTLLATAQVNPT
jgi:hypothetical protein